MKKILTLASLIVLSSNISAAQIDTFHTHPHNSATTVSSYQAHSQSEFLAGDTINDNWHIRTTGDPTTQRYNFKIGAAAGYGASTPANFRALFLDLDDVIGTDTNGNNIYNQISEVVSDMMGMILFSQMLTPDNNYRVAVRGDVTSDFTYNIMASNADVSEVPLPAAMWLFAPALMGLMGFRRQSAKKYVG